MATDIYLRSVFELVDRYWSIEHESYEAGDNVYYHNKNIDPENFDPEDDTTIFCNFDEEIIYICNYDGSEIKAKFETKKDVFDHAYKRLYEYKNSIFSTSDHINKELAAFVWELEKEI
jgi:hypothetical protein